MILDNWTGHQSEVFHKLVAKQEKEYRRQEFSKKIKPFFAEIMVLNMTIEGVNKKDLMHMFRTGHLEVEFDNGTRFSY